jgi:hypothetical protein
MKIGDPGLPTTSVMPFHILLFTPFALRATPGLRPSMMLLVLHWRQSFDPCIVSVVELAPIVLGEAASDITNFARLPSLSSMSMAGDVPAARGKISILFIESGPCINAWSSLFSACEGLPWDGGELGTVK